jgi:hypothetical protein
MAEYLSSFLNARSAGIQTKEKIEIAKLAYYSNRLDYEHSIFKDMYEKRNSMKEEVIQVVSDTQNILNQMLLMTTLIWGVCFEATSLGDFSPNNSRMVEQAVYLGTSIVICSFAMLEGVFLSMYLSEKEALFVSGDSFKSIRFLHSEKKADVDITDVDITVFESKHIKGLSTTLNLLKLVILISTVLLLWTFQLNLSQNDAWGHHPDSELVMWRHIIPGLFALFILYRLYTRYSKPDTTSNKINDGLALTIKKYEIQLKEIYCKHFTILGYVEKCKKLVNKSIINQRFSEDQAKKLEAIVNSANTGYGFVNTVLDFFGNSINSMSDADAAKQSVVLTALNLQEKANMVKASIKYDIYTLERKEITLDQIRDKYDCNKTTNDLSDGQYDKNVRMKFL